jgi:hypothetical protein
MIQAEWRSARTGNAFAGLSAPGDAIFVENITYTPVVAAGPHGRSVVTKITLDGGHTVVDFDDADNGVVKQVAATLKNTNARVDTFVVPHHGSRFGDIEPILALNPGRALIAVNPENRYGHPGGQILSALIDTLGAENVYFTGSDSATVFGRDGVISKAHTAAQRDSYALFVQEAHTRAKARGDTSEVAAYEKVQVRMLSDRGTPPPDFPSTPSTLPPSGPKDPQPDAIVARVQAHGSMHTAAFDTMHVRSGGTAASDVASHRVFSRGDASRTSTGTDTATPNTPASKRRSQRQSTERALHNSRISGANPAGPIVATPETSAGVPSALEATLVVTAPQVKASVAAAPRGGMVFLSGGNLHVAGNASELFGGELDLCDSRICVRPGGEGAAPYVLPFTAGRLFGEVWHRVAERRVESFYLSINPTKSFLQSTDDRDVPVQKLAFGAGTAKGQANEVVTAGDIERSEIGKILWESDVAFKSASLGFDVLSGATPLSPVALSLVQLADINTSDLEVDPNNRWCRLYWSSGAQSLTIDPQTRRVAFRGRAVIARAEPMVLRNGELSDQRSGTWCSGAKQTAASLEKEANGGSRRFPVLNRLRELAELQTFVKWARDNGLTLAPRLANVVAESRADLASFTVPKWTSGIRSNPKVLVQQQTTGTTSRPSRLVHVSAADTAVFDECVLPAWEKRKTEFPAAGVQRKADGTWAGAPPGFITKWMATLASRIAQCSGGRLLPATSQATIDPLADQDLEVFAVKPHVQPVHVHGGVLLGTRSNFLRSAWRDEGILRTPDGMMAFKRIADELHFWNFSPKAGALTGLGQHVVVHGGTVIDAAVEEGSLRFVVSVKPQSVIREELRVERADRFSAGLEWAGARHGSDGSVILEKLAWRCAADDVSCIGVADVSFEQLGSLLQDDASGPILTVRHIVEDAWAIDLDLSRLQSWYQEQWAKSSPTDTSARFMLANGMAQWGFEDDADEAREALIDSIDIESADTILSSVLNQSSVTFADLLLSLDVDETQRELSDALEDRTVTQALAALRRIERAIEPLPAAVSADLYETQARLCERVLDEKKVLPAPRKELEAMLRRARHASKVRQFLAEGTPSPWRENEP